MPSPRAARLVTLLVALAAAAHAWLLAWTCDDAFVSFRYARHLLRGEGLVFNVGERVEGYTNFLWTLLVVPGLALGMTPERWTQALGALAFAAACGVLGGLAFRRGAAVPVAAIALAAHRDAAGFAVSGLETGLFTALAVAAYAAIVTGRRGVVIGGLLGLATLTRPDGVIFAGAAALALGIARDRRLLGFLPTFGAIAGAHLAFRVAYYGAWLPNTYYAKSGDAAWWSQGAYYAWLYVLRYPLVALAPIAGLALLRGAPVSWRAWSARATAEGPLAALLGGAYLVWVLRVGGDFMFGRFLVPATPFALVLLELAIGATLRRGLAAAATLVATFFLVPSSVGHGLGTDQGIVDERDNYPVDAMVQVDARAAVLHRLLAGLPARMAFYGAQARIVYRLDVPTAIEADTGLTDAYVAHLPLAKRGRVGHEKHAPLAYLVDERKVHFVLWVSGRRMRGRPLVPVDFGGVRIWLVTRDPAFEAELAARGAHIGPPTDT